MAKLNPPANARIAPTDLPPTTAQLRDEIDRGMGADKIAHSDPAAAPLGTDEEAAGTPPSPEAIATARAAEIGRGQRVRAERAPGSSAWRTAGGLLLTFVILGVAGALAMGWML